MIEICESLDKAGRLAGLMREFRSGRMLERFPEKKKQRVHGCFYNRILNPDGTVAEDWTACLNGVTTEGMNAALETVFRAGTQFTTWYVGVISNTSFSGVSVSDTMASHGGWIEFTGYSEGVRQTWSPAAASAGVVVNSTVMTFTNGGSQADVRGQFLSTVSTKGASTGKLWGTAPEGALRTLTALQTYQCFYEVDLSALN